ncbi:hypothetical protein Micbo1qcDRAFT_157345 [Microdochium bolleyi]|uniref:Nudix hydrolase domain-containing protein n=1 Tax=Microdochium bolleyi TaxID=196109 RepID=A0A136JE47_9PEZI|nr:hypothetical protein Micbo1qcDRAFT_157345 [Microdochium bolleyi]
MRAASLRNFSGHAALPGGKADTMSETGYQIARREAWEEIGLPLDETKLPKPFRIEALCDLPCSLARTEVAVRPCVAFLHADDADDVAPGIPASSSSNGTSTSTTTAQQRQHRQSTLVEEVMMPRLDAKEVAAVFSAPLHNFLRAADQQPRLDEGEKPLPEGQWYDGYWTRWHGKPWRVHNFHVPVHDQRVVRPSKAADPDAGGTAGASSSSGKDDDALEIADERFLVWGMTGRILVDVARAAYGEEPQFEHNDHYGDEEIIGKLEAAGLLGEKPRRDVGQEAIKEIVKDEKM